MSERQRTALVAGSRLMCRVGVVLCLLLAAIALVVDANEYPGYTPSAFRYLARDVLPLVAIALVNIAVLDGEAGRETRFRLLALAVNVELLIRALPDAVALPFAAGGPPPFTYLLAGVASVLVLGTSGMALSPRSSISSGAAARRESPSNGG